MAMNDFSLSDLAAVIGNRDGDGLGGDNGILWLLLFILIGGFGNRGYGNGGGYGAGGIGGNELYPWLNNSEQISGGFRDQMLGTSINGIQQSVTNGFAGVNQSLCSGFAGVNAGMANGFNQTQLAMLQGFNGIQAQQAQCCCDNQLAMANQTATILAENCADRAAISDGVRDLLTAGVANTQRIVDNDNANYRQIYDWLCQKELRDEQRENEQLRQRITSLELAASQGAQTAQLLADNARQTAALEQYLNPTPIPAYQVPNPNCCQQYYGGCGCAA